MSAARMCNGCRQTLPENAPEGLCPACLAKAALSGSASARGATIDVTPPVEAGTGTTLKISEAQLLAGGDNSPGHALKTGRPFGGYHILRCLGKGGMGAVYEVEEIETGRRLALKVLTHALDSPQARQRFLREGRLAASINHPNSVYVFGTEEIDGLPVITMELVAGGTLQDRVQQRGPLPVAEAVDSVLQVVAGLEAAAKAGVLHRDVKPSNCFIELDGAIKIGDFGLSITTIREETKLTMTGSVLGTPAYASPEQLRGDDMTVRSDIYSVGVTLYYLLTGRVPFEGDNLMRLLATVLERPADSPAKWRKDTPKELCQVVLRCLEKQPSGRFKDYAELRAALRPYSSTEPTPGTLARRVVASIIDSILVTLVTFPLIFVAGHSGGQNLATTSFAEGKVSWPFTVLGSVLTVFYYGALEGVWGASLGKRLCGIRVVGPNRSAPGVQVAVLRAFIVEVVPAAPVLVFTLFFAHGDLVHGNALPAVALANLQWIIVAILFSTVRRRNGFAAIHDLLTHTRVILKPAVALRPGLNLAEAESAPTPAASTVGPYGVLELLEQDGLEELFLGFDARLLRKVWIRRLPPGAPPVADHLRSLARAGRLRWLGGKRSTEEAWDAYEGVAGQPLLSLIHQRQPWVQVRYWVLDLAEELAAALKDHSVPQVLALDRVWITSNGLAKLLDFPAPGLKPVVNAKTVPEDKPPQTELAAAQALLRQLVVAALEGRTVAASEAHPAAIQLPLPLHVKEVFEEWDSGFEPRALANRLRPMLDRVASVSRRRRLGVVAGCSALSLIATAGMVTTFLALGESSRKHPELVALQTALEQANLFEHTSGLASGLDKIGNAYSGQLLGPSVTWEGTVFSLGPTNAVDAVACAGQQVGLPAGKFPVLRVLGAAVDGHRLNETFTVTYSDKSIQSFTQNFSDWCKPQSYPHESKALVMPHRCVSKGTNENIECCLYGYTFDLDATKTVKTLTLPTNSYVVLLAASLGVPATLVDLAPHYNLADGIVGEGSTFALAPHLAKACGMFVTGHFRQSVTNSATWGTLTGMIMSMQGQKNQAEKLLADHPPPTDSEMKQATGLLQLSQPRSPLLKPAAAGPREAILAPSARILPAIFCITLLCYSGLPALAAALLFRGGLVLRFLGLAVVKRDGSKASRLRIFWRILLAWSPFVLLTYLLLSTSLHTNSWMAWFLSTAGVLVCSALTAWSLLLPERSLQDRLAGTALVPR